MKMRLKTLSALALIVLLAGTVMNCSSPAQSTNSNTFTIAVVEEEPGEKGNPTAQSIYAGALLAAKQIQERTGVIINIQPYDDNNDVDAAAGVAEEIARSNAIAVIGHSSIEASHAAAKTYDNNAIPSINALPATEQMMRDHSSQFNITYTAESEAAYLANYVIKVLDKDKSDEDTSRNKATIIYTNDDYGTALQKQFGNTFRGLGGTVTFREMIDLRQPLDVRLDQIVSTIIAANQETDNPGTIFVATDDKTAAELVVLMKRKGVSYPIIGASNLSSPVFMAMIADEPEEITQRGYFTDGILTTRSIIFDSANRYANQFLQEYQEAHDNSNPGDLAVNGYDAMLTLFAAIENLPANEPVTREAIRSALLKMDSANNGMQGIVSPVYFDPSRNAPRAARFGIYQNGEIVSANTQFEPISTPNEIKDLQVQISKGRIMTVNGMYVYAANVVYAGVDLLGIDEVDIKTSTYKVDFYLWFRYRPHESDPEFKPEEFVFTNVESLDGDPVLIREDKNTDGTVLKTYRVSGVFKNQFQFHDYPFDRQKLVVEFRNQNATTSFIQYVVDRVGMRYKTVDELLDNFRLNGAFDSIFGWEEKSARVYQDIFPTFSTFGNPQNFDRKVSTNFSLIDIEVGIQRNSLQYIIKSLLPLFITLVLAYITFFLPLGHSERLAVGSTALLTTAFFHLTLADALPEIGYTVAMEYFFYASYVMSALIVFLETLSIRLEKKSEDTNVKEEKEAFHKRREHLNMIGRFAYPAILLVAIVFETFIYNGILPLGPNEEADSRHLVNLIHESRASGHVKSAATESPATADGAVKLTLSTWRPEDTKQIQVLIDSFEEYAKSKGKNITIEYRPVMSVNYDSVLDIQLSRGEGPDLFYVRPFSVDGSIAKYLAPLNDLPITENYADTKSVAWQSSTGKYYAVPFLGVVQGVYYNKKLFDKYGVSEPATWQEFLDTLEVIQKKDPKIIPLANALNKEEDSEMFMSIAANFLGGPNGRGQLMRTDGTGLCYNTTRVLNSYKAIEDLKQYLPKDAGTITSQNTKELFYTQQAVMMFGGSWDLQKVKENATEFEWGVIAVPAPVFHTTYVIFQPDIAVGMNNATKHQAEALMFLNWLMTKEAVDLAAQNLPGFYSLNNLEALQGNDEDDEKFLKLVNEYDTDIRWTYTEINNKYPSASAIVRKGLYDMVTSNLKAAEAARRLQAGLGEWYEPAQTCMR